MEAMNINTLNQISRCQNNFKSVGSCNLRDVCELGYDINFYTKCIPRMTTIVTYYNNTAPLPSGEIKELLYCIAKKC